MFQVDGSPEDYYAILVNCTQPDCMPLFSEGDDVDSSDDEDDMEKDIKNEDEDNNEDGNENGNEGGNEGTDNSDEELDDSPRPGKRQRLFSDQD